MPSFTKYKQEFMVECDSSGVAVGAILSQDSGIGPQPVYYFSKKLDTTK